MIPYETIGFGMLFLAILMVITSIVQFFVWDVPGEMANLSGKTKRKRVKSMQDNMRAAQGTGMSTDALSLVPFTGSLDGSNKPFNNDYLSPVTGGIESTGSGAWNEGTSGSLDTGSGQFLTRSEALASEKAQIGQEELELPDVQGGGALYEEAPDSESQVDDDELETGQLGRRVNVQPFESPETVEAEEAPTGIMDDEDAQTGILEEDDQSTGIIEDPTGKYEDVRLTVTLIEEKTNISLEEK